MKYYFVPLNGIQWLTLLLLAAMVGGFAYGFKQQQDTNAKIAQVQAHQNDALHSILCRGQAFVKHSRPPVETPAQRAAGLRFYRQALKHAYLQPCD